MAFGAHRVQSIALACALLVPAVALAQESRSAAVASELTRLLDQAKLDSIAAKHETAGQYVIEAGNAQRCPSQNPSRCCHFSIGGCLRFRD